MFSKLSVVDFVDLRQFGDSNPFFLVIYQNTHVVSIWQKDFMLDEMCFKMKCTRGSDMPASLGTNCVSTVNIIFFPDFVSVIFTDWQDFAASLTEKCQSAFLVLSTNYMPHKISRPLYIPQYIESLHHRMTEISFNFINILNPFPNYFAQWLTLIV